MNNQLSQKKRQWVKRGLMGKKWTNNFKPLFPLNQQF